MRFLSSQKSNQIVLVQINSLFCFLFQWSTSSYSLVESQKMYLLWTIVILCVLCKHLVLLSRPLILNLPVNKGCLYKHHLQVVCISLMTFDLNYICNNLTINLQTVFYIDIYTRTFYCIKLFEWFIMVDFMLYLNTLLLEN